MEKAKQRKRINISEESRAVAVWIILVGVQLCLYIFLFLTVKTAHHEDEFFSYGMANSYDRPFLYGSAYSVYDNYNTWMKGRDFWNYITVQKGQGFHYGRIRRQIRIHHCIMH